MTARFEAALLVSSELAALDSWHGPLGAIKTLPWKISPGGGVTPNLKLITSEKRRRKRSKRKKKQTAAFIDSACLANNNTLDFIGTYAAWANHRRLTVFEKFNLKFACLVKR